MSWKLPIPVSLNLNDNQKRIAQEFADTIPPRDLDDFDCCMSSNYIFTVYSTGIGDNVTLSNGDKSVWLDDGCDP